ncbi:MAG: CPC_1213 family protein [Eubacteriales bacterium]
MSGNKKTSTKNGKKVDGTFRSKNIKHDPHAESARAVFGKDGTRPDNDFSSPYDNAR